MAGIDYRALRRQLRLGSVLALLGVEPGSRRGNQVRGPCPVHGSSSPHNRSFSAHLGRSIWRCFVCGASGNALDLWQRVRGQDLYPALLELYRQLGRTPPWLPPTPSCCSSNQEPKDVSES